MILEPIVNPWLFYALDVLHALDIFSIFAVLVFLIIAMYLWNAVYDKDYDFDCKFAPIIFTVLACLNIVITLAIPSQETMYKMAVAYYTTPDNIQAVTEYVCDTASAVTDKATETIVDIIDYAGEKIYELRNNVNPSDGE